jgi:hypothetical protein
VTAFSDRIASAPISWGVCEVPGWGHQLDPSRVLAEMADLCDRIGLTFVGVDGNPERPWKWDNNNIQIRTGTAYQLNERTVLRGGYGRYFLNPTGQGHLQGFSIQTTLVASNDANRTPLYNLGNPFPNGVAQPPGSSLGPLGLGARGTLRGGP